MVPVQENLRAEPNRHSMNAIPPTPDSSWLNPSAEQQGLARYVSTLRERKWLIVLTVLITTLAAVVYVLTASKVYNAEADLLITPVGNSDTTLSGLGLITSSSDPTRDVETASKLVTSTTVAKRVKGEAPRRAQRGAAAREGVGRAGRDQQRRRRDGGGRLAQGGAGARPRGRAGGRGEPYRQNP